jgi:predicted lipoprotein with Yx(FWY)xxD motif
MLGAVRNATIGAEIVVDASGRTLYRLSPETPRHLLCTRSCLRSWLPLTVPSPRSRLVASGGVDGRLATFRRPDGRLQVTLRGIPLYLFSEDRSGGQANGRWIRALGGVWDIVLAQAATMHVQPPPVTPSGSHPAPGGPVPGPKLPPNPPPI